MPFKIHCTDNVAHCQNTFRFLPPVILEWDLAESSFSTSGKPNPWFLLYFGFALVFGNASIVFTLFHFRDFPIVNVIFCAILLLIASSIFGCVAVMALNAENIVQAYNQLRSILYELGMLKINM